MTTRRAIALIALLAFPVPEALASKRPYRIAPAQKDDDGDWVRIDHLERSIQGVRLQIRYLDHAEAAEVIERTIGRPIDLITARDGENSPGHLAFVLQIDNDSSVDVMFNPSEAWLQTEKGDTKPALDYSAFHMTGRRLGPSAPTTDEVAEIFFDRVVTINPGGKVRKLLAFDAPREDRYKRFVVNAAVTVGTQYSDFIFPFRKFFEK